MLRHFCTLTVLAAFFLPPASAQDQAAKAQTVRPEVGKPLQSAIDLLKGKKAKEGLAMAREAQAVPNKTPYESYMVTRVIAQAAAGAGEPGVAAKAFEEIAGAASAADAERRQFAAAAAGQYYTAKDYAKAAELAARYAKLGGTDKSVHTIYVQALYLGNNFAAAAKAISADVEAEEDSGKAPAEEQLQLLASASLQQRDTAGYAKALEKLLTYYPKRDYWLNLVHAIATRPGFSERLALDVARLKVETGTMRTGNEYLEAAQLSLIDGFPIEAARIIDKGYAAGLLGSGPEAARHKRLKDMAAKSLAEDKKSLNANADAAKDAKALFNEGFNLVLHGKSEQGLQMMENALQQGIAGRRPDHARLQLAYAYHLAGQNQKAVQIFRSVQGTDGSGALARAWAIRLARAS
jgi:outer membrane protein assembly factor BamD (BamD/ComL family)